MNLSSEFFVSSSRFTLYPDKAIQLGALLSPKWERSQAGLEASLQTEIEDAWEGNTRSNTGSDQCTVVKLGMAFSNLPKTVRPQQIKRPTFPTLHNCYSLQFPQTAALQALCHLLETQLLVNLARIHCYLEKRNRFSCFQITGACNHTAWLSHTDPAPVG